MSPEDPNNPGLNTHPDLSSVPLPEPAPIKSPYAPIGGTLGDIANDVAANDPSMNRQPTPVPTPGAASGNPSTNTSAAQSTTSADAKPKSKKLPLIIGIIIAVVVIVGVILFFIFIKSHGEGGDGGGPSKTGQFYNNKAFVVSSGASGKKMYAIYNSEGEAITDFIFDETSGKFIGGTVMMRKDGKYGLVDQEGKEVIEFGKYGKIAAYGGLYGLNKDGKDVLVNNKGETVVEYNPDDFSSYSDYSQGLKTAYTLYRKENHYTVYNPFGGKVTEFDSDSAPTISSPGIGVEGSHTIIVYSGGAIVLNDEGGEVRRVDKNITKRLFGIFASKSGNVIGLSTVNAQLVDALGSVTIPNDGRDNALIMGSDYYEYGHKNCAGLYYNDDFVEGDDEDGYVLCFKSGESRVIMHDGSLAPNTFPYKISNWSLRRIMHKDEIYPITNDSYAVMTNDDNDKSYSIFYDGKKVANLVSVTNHAKADTKNFTKTVTGESYNVLGMNDNYIIQHISSKEVYKFSDNTFSEYVGRDKDEDGELIFMNKKGEKICTFDKKGYTGTTSRPLEILEGKGVDNIDSLDATGFVNGVALVRKVGKDGKSYDEKGYTRINDKCEVVDENKYYEKLSKRGDVALLISKKGNQYVTEVIDKEGKTVATATNKGSTPTIKEFTKDFLLLGDEKKSFIGYGKPLKQLDHLCNPSAGIYVDENYLVLESTGKSLLCEDKEAVGGQYFYFLPNGKEFYQWKEPSIKAEK